MSDLQEQAVGNSYDRVPYRSFPFRQTHPDRLGTIATLFGLQPAPATRCRVLELGCAAGGNLLPMAEQYPESEFVGIDASLRQIRDGQQLIEASGLRNVRLQHADILEFQPEGEFDYIISHGVYSWVPDAVQDRMLGICSESLSRRGVAYISYNTYPGWHMRGMIRDIMRYRARSFADPEHQLHQARGLLAFLSKSVNPEGNPYGALLKNELEAISGADDSYLIHEHLEEVNEPLHFHQFAERAAVKGLAYLGEADFGVMSLENFPEPVRAMLEGVSRDVIETEQYMDFLRNRAFRQTLLVPAETRIERPASPRRLQTMRVASSATPEGEFDLHSSDRVVFRRGSSVLATNDPVVKAAMLELRKAWPASIPFVELASNARSIASGRAAAVDSEVMSAETENLARTLLRCFATGQVDLHLTPSAFTTEAAAQPTASPLARAQAARGGSVASRRHVHVELDDLHRQLLMLLNGERDRSALTDALSEKVASGQVVLHMEGRRIVAPDEVRRLLSAQLPDLLQGLARQALLV